MVDTGVVCGDVVPEGTQICKRCEKGSSNDRVSCPDCKAILKIMSSHWYTTKDGRARSTIFHCNNCHRDWEKDEEFIAKPIKFTRKFWG